MCTYYINNLNDDSILNNQPNKINIKLKPHQLAGLYKAVEMETKKNIYYKKDEIDDDYYKIRTNIGIIGDKVGYGKTLLALSIISEIDINNIYMNNKCIKTYNTNLRDYNNNNSIIIKHIKPNINEEFIKTTLIIVPRGPVYTQWVDTIKKTSLNILEIDDYRKIKKLPKLNSLNKDIIKKYFEKYDAILIKNTTLKLFTYYYNNNDLIFKWGRIIIDEAHEILNSIVNFSYLYIWLISATYMNILYNKCKLTSNIKDLIKNELNFILIKSNESFIKKSFELPIMTEKIYKCKMSLKLGAIRPFLSKSLIEKLDGSDLKGMIKEMGGKVVSETGIIEIFTLNMNKEIHNKKCELEHVKQLEMDNNERNERINSILKNLLILENRLENLKIRLNDIDLKTCTICLDNIVNPILLECSHSFCVKCLVLWNKTKNTCPECRKIFNISNTILKENKLEDKLNENIEKSKEITLLNIIKNKKDKKFLIFSKIENGFSNIKEILDDNNISYNEIKGNTTCMNNILKNFKEGLLNVILLNTHYAGSGIDISFATDIIIYHSMDNYREQAIGRAYRVGRTIPLTVHTLLYEHEINL